MVYKFKLYQEVVVSAIEGNLSKINGKTGYIMGSTKDGEQDFYAVSIEGICWYINRNHLRPTDKQLTKQDFYDGSNMKVLVNSKGKGKIKRTNLEK